MRILTTVFASILSCSAGSIAFGQADETRIRSDAGGIYQAPAFGFGSVSGIDSDFVIFTDSNGKVVDSGTIDKYANPQVIGIFPPPPNPVIQTIDNSGGSKTLRFDYSVLSKQYPALPGGTVEVRRNGQLVDRDRLYR